MKYFLPQEVMMSLYNYLFMPYLTSALVVWGGTYQCHLDVIARSALRSANNLPYNCRTSPYFKTYNLLKLPDLYKYSVSINQFGADDKPSRGILPCPPADGEKIREICIWIKASSNAPLWLVHQYHFESNTFNSTSSFTGST